MSTFSSAQMTQEGPHRYFDAREQVTVVKLFSGDCYVTQDRSEMLVTILGSCVAACICDPIAGVGGMNHFLLPDGSEPDSANSASLRYGAYAMECLINEILKRGGRKPNLEVKIFGGANVIESSALIGSRNAEFVTQFLKREGLPIKASHLGDRFPRRVHYYPGSGRVQMRLLGNAQASQIAAEEKRFATRAVRNTEGDVELF